MASNNTFMFSQPDLVTSSFSMFYDMKKKGELSDVSVKIDNRVFAAHRIILAAAIPYFRTMFTSSLAESRQKEVTMKELDPSALESLIDFAYTSKVKITTQNVQSLLIASEFLQLTKVRDSCSDFLSKRLDPNNVMSIRGLADSLNCVSLVKNADIYIRKHFEAFLQTKEFLNLSFPFLNHLIKEDDLQVSSEERVFDAVMSWVKTDAKRHQYLPKLLMGVRMTFLTPEFLIKKASKEKLIMDSVPCRNLLDEAKHYHLLPEEGASGCSFAVTERCYGASCGIFVFCRSKANGLTILKYRPTTDKWNTVLKDKTRSDLQHVLTIGEEIYIFREKAFETFNPRTLTWKPRATFPTPHSSFKNAVPFNGKVYWFGSNTQDPYRGIYFDNQHNQWISFRHGNLRMYSGDELLPSGNSVYIFGSSNRANSTGRCNVRYNHQTRQVSGLSPMQYNRSAFGSAVLGNAVYVCGGISFPDAYSMEYYYGSSDVESILRSTEIYTESQGWRTASSMNDARRNFSLLAYEGKLYAVGGTTGGPILVEVYDPTTDKWSYLNGASAAQCDFVKAVAISTEKN